MFKAKLALLKASGFDFKLDFIIYVLLAVLHGVGSDMRRLHDASNLDPIKAAWKRLDQTLLDYVINLLRTHAFVDHSEEINSPFALVTLLAFVAGKVNGKLNEQEIRHAVKWFFYAQLRQRYISQTPQRLDKDLSIIRESAAPFDEMLANLQQERPLEVTADEFVGRDIRHPLFSLMRWYFKSRDAVCFGTGVGIRKPMGERYMLENDHIFPYSALRDSGYPVDNRFKYQLAQELTNRAILTKLENREKSDTPAADYLLKAKSLFPGALDKQSIPADPSLWELGRYEEFLDARRQLLAGGLNKFLTRITETNVVVAALSLEDRVAEGEHDQLEFKSSLRWDLKEARVNKDLEQVVLKSIAALANKDGGTLLIGVQDDGAIFGLEADYVSLDGNRDKFERHLRGLANNRWGAAAMIGTLSLSFPAIGDREVCVVDVLPGKRPLFLEVTDKQGVKSERLFVRTGNASLPIESSSQAASYINQRFPNYGLS